MQLHWCKACFSLLLFVLVVALDFLCYLDAVNILKVQISLDGYWCGVYLVEGGGKETEES